VRAAFLLEPKRIEIREIEPPRLKDDEVLISPRYVGICGSDVSLYAGHRVPDKYPLVPGHEIVGHVAGRGEGVEKFSVGQRVVVEPNYNCGQCDFCRSGRGNICPNKRSLGVTIPGCLAQVFAAPAEYVWAVPDAISDEDAVTIEPLAVSLHALWQSEVGMGDTIAVLGCGSTGLLLIQAAIAQGIRVLAHDKLDGKLELALELGAVMSASQDVTTLWREEGVSTVFECAGAASTVELALGSIPRGGQVILVGLSSAQASFVPLRFVREGLRVSGSIIYDHPRDFARTIALVRAGALSPRAIVSRTFPFDEITPALELACTGESGKILLDMEA
jgi:2-desacetyl-2-hydroxyethyl bacteriochlorophyllide A dehydrogenase